MDDTNARAALRNRSHLITLLIQIAVFGQGAKKATSQLSSGRQILDGDA
jgi:hypothetical protein